MPWRGQPVAPTDTLGFQVAEWIEANCIIPDGFHQGEPFRLTDEMLEYLCNFFRIHPHAKPDLWRLSAPFVYRGGQLRRPQKWGKSPFGAALALAHMRGPVVFDGRDAKGEPVGRQHPTPWVQIVAVSEEQTDNTWLALYEMVVNSKGGFANIPGLDAGMSAIYFPGGGKVEPRTASGRSRLGARLFFAIFDEPHLMVESNGGVLLATTMKRNLAGMGGRWCELTNSYDPAEGSVAQRTAESVLEGGTRDVLIDCREPDHRPDLADDADALAMLKQVYGDSWWVDPERILADARDPATCPTTPDAMRYFFNLIEAGVRDAVDAVIWDSQKREMDLVPGQMLGLGFDGSRTSDCTSLVASRVSDGRWFHLQTWDPADYSDHKVPTGKVDEVVTAAFEAYDVRYFFYDPELWQDYGDRWAGRWPKRIVEYATNSDRRMDDMVGRFLSRTDFTHDGHPTLALHAKSAALARGGPRRPRPEEGQTVMQHYLRVVKKRETLHIDAFVAGLLSEMARGKAIEDGALQEESQVFVSWR